MLTNLRKIAVIFAGNRILIQIRLIIRKESGVFSLLPETIPSIQVVENKNRSFYFSYA